MKRPCPRPDTRAVALLGAADGMAEAAEPYSTVFVDAGRPDDFIAQLKDAAQALDQSLVGRRGLRVRRSKATAGTAA